MLVAGQEENTAPATGAGDGGSNNSRAQCVDVRPETRAKKRPRVSFEAADIVEFEPTLYTTTVTSGGIPVGMSLKERSRSRRRLDSFEMERKEIRVGRQNYMEEGYLDPQEREVILNNAGCAMPAMATVEAEVNRIIAHRRETNEIDFEYLYATGEIAEEEVGQMDAFNEQQQEEDDDEVEEEEEEEEEEEQQTQQEEPEDAEDNNQQQTQEEEEPIGSVLVT